MNVIVSSTLKKKYKNFKVVATIKELLDLDLKEVDSVIFHELSEKEFDIGIHIPRLSSEGISHFIYISKKPMITIKMCIRALGGVVLQDDFYFEDEDELLYLVTSDATSLTEADDSKSSIEVLGEFFQNFANNSPKISNKFYLNTVNKALKELIKSTNTKDYVIQNMGTSAVAIFETASSILSDMEKHKEELEAKLQEIESVTAMQPRPRFALRDPAIRIFPPVEYTGGKRILLIHEYSHCRYLTSCILAYQRYLSLYKNVQCKLVFIHGNEQDVCKKYSGTDFTALSPETLSRTDLLDANILDINCPKSEVIHAILNTKEEYYIFIDRLYREPIIKGRVVKLNAISGCSDLTRYNLNTKDCIFSTVAENENSLCIPHIPQFSSVRETKYSLYIQTILNEKNSLFEKIDKKFLREVRG